MSYLRTGDTEHHAGSLSPGVGRVPFGALDYGSVYIQQKNQARRTFGSTGVNMPGRTDIQWPNLSGRAAIDVLVYWRKNGDDVFAKLRYKKALFTEAETKDYTAHELAFIRALKLVRIKELVYKPALIVLENVLIPEALAVDIWKGVDPLGLSLRAMAETPSQWSIVWWATKERAKELPGDIANLISRASGAVGGLWQGLWTPLNTLVKWSAIGLAAYVGYKVVTRREQTPKRRR
jgi:hypothetical protein